MLLGVYWYYGFPEGLYQFDFFAFRPGLGGHADGPAELTATVRSPAPAALLAEVRAVAARYPGGYLFGKVHGPLLRLALGDYALPDYAFHVAGELEKVLRQQQATPTTELLPADTPLLRLAVPHDPTPPYRSGCGLLQAVSTAPRLHRAGVALLRLDCHLPLARQADFLTALDALCGQFALNALYYFDHRISFQTNLIVFFGNGRQGVGGQPLRYTNTAALTPAVLACLAAHGGQARHLGSSHHYPERGSHSIRMVDADFVL
ncbi:hypothetical protein QMK33_10490 [Hymenobacter sp. H14-R3]|uniref:hypothetical protein n=1 Tax=Hymenobacter sp. H14-R3 TaxID=3046308 RepID=UPI0024BB7C93|nr:hypothetical protein [Hymenobacter sp. H14-R3]MDJ0365583.1 hypothetical protein [Hymenobacter sp. H14-R3]